jgi:hypothetical protein
MQQLPSPLSPLPSPLADAGDLRYTSLSIHFLLFVFLRRPSPSPLAQRPALLTIRYRYALLSTMRIPEASGGLSGGPVRKQQVTEGHGTWNFRLGTMS